MLLLSRSDVERALTPEACLQAVEHAMRAVSAGDVVQPLRSAMAVPHTQGKLVLMPGWMGGERPLFDIKIVSKFPRAPGDSHGTHVGAVMLFDAADGLPLALIEGGALTGLRTAAASALATRLLSRPDSRVLTVLGAGEQARRHIRAIRGVRPIERVVIWVRNTDRARDLAAELDLTAVIAEDAEAAVAQSDVVCTTTSANEPVLHGRWLRPGAHVNLVGSAIASAAEADEACVLRSRFYVDAREAALQEAGELRRALRSGVVGEDHIVGEIGEVALGRIPGRRTPEEITLYKSLGVAAQDIAAASALLSSAQAMGLGRRIDLDL